MGNNIWTLFYLKKADIEHAVDFCYDLAYLYCDKANPILPILELIEPAEPVPIINLINIMQTIFRWWRNLIFTTRYCKNL